MKKISTLLIMLMILISISSIALADEAEDDPEGETEESDVDNETVTEIEIMNYSIGAELRLLQLEKAILKNLLKGEMAVEVLKGLEYNTTELEEILSEMRILLEEVRAVNASSNNSVQLFVEFKSMAMNLTKQFRETINNSLDGEKLIQIRERIKEMMSEELKTCSNMVRNKIKQFNRNQLYKLYGLIGEYNNSFVNQYMNGNVTLAELKIQINKAINQMNRERKYEIFSEIKEENIKKKIQAKASFDDLKNKGHGKENGNGKSNGSGK